MKREFFGKDIEEALQKASHVLRIPVEKIPYRFIEESFGKPLGPKKKAIIVDSEGPEEKEESVEQWKKSYEQAQKGDLVDWVDYFVGGIFENMGVEANIECIERKDDIVVNIQLESEELDLRKGKGRELRSVIQHLSNLSLTKKGEKKKKVIVDIGGNLEGRSEKIQEVASRIANKVILLEKPVYIHLMDSQDRRILHTTLMDNRKVKTQGQGERQFRVLSVMPGKKEKSR